MTTLVTGASGFIGRQVVGAALATGQQVRALVRRPPATALAAGAEVLRGDLGDEAALARAVGGVDAVIHLAGLTAARDDEEFARVNVEGTRRLTRAATAAGVRRMVLVSSLSARGPAGARGPVSAYGRSKLAGEQAMVGATDGLQAVIVRPTVVYGPGDRALLPLFRLARHRLAFIPRGAGALTVVHVEDLARALASLAAAATLDRAAVLEASDGREYSWTELLHALGAATGRRVRPRQLPDAAFAAAAHASDLLARLTGVPRVFGRDKLIEMRGSWPADPRAFWAAAGREPRFDFARGSEDTARAYRLAGWL